MKFHDQEWSGPDIKNDVKSEGVTSNFLAFNVFIIYLCRRKSI